MKSQLILHPINTSSFLLCFVKTSILNTKLISNFIRLTLCIKSYLSLWKYFAFKFHNPVQNIQLWGKKLDLFEFFSTIVLSKKINCQVFKKVKSVTRWRCHPRQDHRRQHRLPGPVPLPGRTRLERILRLRRLSDLRQGRSHLCWLHRRVKLQICPPTKIKLKSFVQNYRIRGAPWCPRLFRRIRAQPADFRDPRRHHTPQLQPQYTQQRHRLSQNDPGCNRNRNQPCQAAFPLAGRRDLHRQKRARYWMGQHLRL